MNAIPPKISRPAPANSVFAGALAEATLLGIAAVVYFFNPTTHAFYPVCQFHRLTGLNCPGCGATRALYALLHGRVSTALRDNALFILGLAAVVVRGSWLAMRRWRGQAPGEFFPAKALWPALGLAVAFTVLRNLPWFSFLSPAP